jgi:hypothetical protein
VRVRVSEGGIALHCRSGCSASSGGGKRCFRTEKRWHQVAVVENSDNRMSNSTPQQPSAGLCPTLKELRKLHKLLNDVRGIVCLTQLRR